MAQVEGRTVEYCNDSFYKHSVGEIGYLSKGYEIRGEYFFKSFII